MANPVLQLRVLGELRLAAAAQAPVAVEGPSRTADVLDVERALAESRSVVERFVRRFVAECDVDDVVQETLTRALVGAAEFRSEARFTTWLLTIARNACADHHRRQSRRREERMPTRGGASGRFTAPMERIADAVSPAADRRAMEAEIRSRVLVEVDALPEHLRRVFVLRALDGMRFPEIAAALGVGVPTVKSRMRYAVESLRDRVSDLQSWLTGCMPALEA